jgi:hypothetical protein
MIWVGSIVSTIERIIDALEKMEARAGIPTVKLGRNTESASVVPVNINRAPDLSMADLIPAAHKLGFEVSFKPL